jgi:hypothetical protein
MNWFQYKMKSTRDALKKSRKDKPQKDNQQKGKRGFRNSRQRSLSQVDDLSSITEDSSDLKLSSIHEPEDTVERAVSNGNAEDLKETPVVSEDAPIEIENSVETTADEEDPVSEEGSSAKLESTDEEVKDADQEEEPVEADMTDEVDTAVELEETPATPVVSEDASIEIENNVEVLVGEEDISVDIESENEEADINKSKPAVTEVISSQPSEDLISMASSIEEEVDEINEFYDALEEHSTSAVIDTLPQKSPSTITDSEVDDDAQNIQKVKTQKFEALPRTASTIATSSSSDLKKKKTTTATDFFPGKQKPKTRWISPTKRFVVKESVNTVIEKVRKMTPTRSDLHQMLYDRSTQLQEEGRKRRQQIEDRIHQRAAERNGIYAKSGSRTRGFGNDRLRANRIINIERRNSFREEFDKQQSGKITIDQANQLYNRLMMHKRRVDEKRADLKREREERDNQWAQSRGKISLDAATMLYYRNTVLSRSRSRGRAVSNQRG